MNSDCRTTMRGNIANAVLGISFDAIPVSGIVGEFLNISYEFYQSGCQIFLDLGFDIRLDKNNFGRPIEPYASWMPDWVTLVRTTGDPRPNCYNEATISAARAAAIAATEGWREDPSNAAAIEAVTEELLSSFRALRIAFLIVENGTLPENPIVTEALYRAIWRYGIEEGLGKFVLWRDHDLMWSVEPHKYGSYPYPGIPQPIPEISSYIQFAVLTDWMAERFQSWVPGICAAVMANRFYSAFSISPCSLRVRRNFDVPKDAYLLARCTRVIPQKCISRDIYLLRQLRDKLIASGDTRDIFLAITGPIDEDPSETMELKNLACQLDIEGQIRWCNGLEPHNPLLRIRNGDGGMSVLDLLLESDLSIFLTSYDYEGFGNPPGEAMATGVPFISSSYELYESVYGKLGVMAPLLPISPNNPQTGYLPNWFVEEVLNLLRDPSIRARTIEVNRAIAKRFFSPQTLCGQLRELFTIANIDGGAFGRVRMFNRLIS